MRARRLVGWLALVVLLELATRAIVYGLAPSADPTARSLGGQLGGPGFVSVVLVALLLAGTLSGAAVWLASLGVRERWSLAEERLSAGPPRIAVPALAARAAVLAVVGWLVFAAVETLLHLRAGLGFHGLECLVGPVHRNALPVVAALSLLACAALAVAGLVLAWMRRTVRAFTTPCRPPATHPAASACTLRSLRRPAPSRPATPVRGPPFALA